ncbi:MAG: ACP phosphodiesterase [Flavobacteriales bacterium]
MNYLGHLFLSGEEPLVIVGNFMADDIKGRHFHDHHPLVQQGIRLHRAIDSYTDAHPAQREGRARLRVHAGRYSGVVMDMFYDHLLARYWATFRSEPLARYADRMYRLLVEHRELMPPGIRMLLKHMAAGDWLTTYASEEGLARALSGLAARVPEGHVMRGAEAVLWADRDQYTAEFEVFMRDIQEHLRDHR